MIRQRQAGDLRDLQLAMREVHEAEGYPSMWPADPMAFLQPSGTVAGRVAVQHEQVMGQVLLCSLSHGSWAAQLPPETLEVKRLFVAPAGRGLGLGRALMEAATAHARTLGRPAALQVAEHNRAALALYQALDWRHLTRGQATWSGPDGHRPMVAVLQSPPI
ncbi:hypothetical protein GCM10008955_16160 [Deinococcus malanensis]|uniref:N-acetyltransferase domain-containing protein n=1 Tax=Deinococcus malanensis TaxID=1706855 RepID=A0ABQ2ES99_9DEIO|nr:GNAT family N-acetyltransferase [Deinococcus malanensis]GGK23341.1 hypothetical protein GCM10008955_16160 [Deinococcus malanensis]